MSVSTFMGLQTALKGILAHQRALDTAGHNIANANTEGYTRQDTIMTASDAFVEVNGFAVSGQAHIGTGVDVTSYRRIRDTFLDLQYRAQNMKLGEAATNAKQLDRAELALSEPGSSGLSSVLNKFWSAWGDFANNPDKDGVRQAVISQGVAVASALSSIDGQLATVSTQALAEYNSITGPAGEIELAARDIANLNAAIQKTYIGGAQPNDLLDKRDALLDKLSQYGQVSVTDLGGGTISVNFGDAATPLVNDTTVTWPQALTNPGGKLGALNDLTKPGGTIATYRSDLNAVAKQIADSVNAIHNPPAFFTYTAGSEASTINVAVTTTTLRATATGTAGDNEIARGINALRGGSADQAYSAFMNKIASDVRDSKRAESTAQSLVDGVQDRRDSTSGVSLDEEMTNIMRFQRAFQACARAMNAMDEQLDTLINRTGRVGL